MKSRHQVSGIRIQDKKGENPAREAEREISSGGGIPARFPTLGFDAFFPGT
jgi:hypothetical protein